MVLLPIPFLPLPMLRRGADTFNLGGLNMVDICAFHVKWGFDGSFGETNPSFACSAPGLYKIFFFLAARIHTQKICCNIICLLEVLCNNRPKASQALVYKMLLVVIPCQSCHDNPAPTHACVDPTRHPRTKCCQREG